MRRPLILLLLALVAGLLSAPPAHAAPPLSQGKPATASSVEAAPFGAANAVDGDPGTRWSSAFSDPQWLTVDLGATASIGSVVLNWETAYASAFRLQTSPDNSTWTTIHTTTSSTGGVQTINVTGSGRYVRLYADTRATAWGVSLWEFQVHAGGTSGGEQLLSYGKPGTASSSQHDGNCWECTPARAFDLDPASRWATSPTTGWVDPGWIAVDLGATAQITKIVLQWDPAYARSYQIQVSPNGTDWTPIYSTTTSTG
ncbi:MAG: discoidin domain-containing protein, partial [Thermoactinospora sp.]|nr:discoidin domain-containing protein [Thermoactinospora sp.]